MPKVNSVVKAYHSLYKQFMERNDIGADAHGMLLVSLAVMRLGDLMEKDKEVIEDKDSFSNTLSDNIMI